jgi:hypothetical protein
MDILRFFKLLREEKLPFLLVAYPIFLTSARIWLQLLLTVCVNHGVSHSKEMATSRWEYSTADVSSPDTKPYDDGQG